MASKSKKHKTKTSKPPKIESFGKRKEELKKEITQLEEQKKIAPKGIKGFLQRGAINKAIYQRKSILKGELREESLKRKISGTRQQIELQKAKNELQELRKKQQVDFSGISGFGYPAQKKQVKIEDLY